MYCANSFDEYVTVQALNLAGDGFGGQVSTWSDRTGLWCKIVEKSVGEGEVNGRIESEKSIEITTRYRDDILETDRIVLDGQFFDIKGIQDIDRKKTYLRIIADSQVSQ